MISSWLSVNSSEAIEKTGFFCVLCTTHVQFLKFLLSKKHPPPTLTLPLEGGGEGGGDSFWVAAMPLCGLCER